MSADWSFAQVLVALLVVPLVLHPSWWAALGRIAYHAAGLICPDKRQCRSFAWANLPPGPLHVCSMHACPHSALAPSALFNAPWPATRGGAESTDLRNAPHPKPSELFLRRHYIHIDRLSLLAWILCSFRHSEATPGPAPHPHRFDNGGVHAHFHPVQGTTRFLLARLRADVVADPLPAKDDAHRILAAGYPPFYRAHHNIGSASHPVWLPSPIADPRDLARGAWVVAAGLAREAPLPLYMDLYPTFGARRTAGLFWRALDRVQRVLRGPLATAFPGNEALRVADDEVAAMLEAESRSLDERPSVAATRRRWTADECAALFALFNGPVGPVSAAYAQEIRARFGEVLPDVLQAAVDGVGACVDYLRPPPRELNAILPVVLEGVDDFYVEVEG